MDSERYDIIATMPPSTSDDKVLLMLQRLLVERFQMKLHWENRETSVYSMTLAGKGARLKEAKDGTKPNVRFEPSGFAATGKSLNDLAGILTLLTGVPVVDMTGLRGLYDFQLEWRDRGEPIDRTSNIHPALGPDPSGPSAVLSSLKNIGLKAVAQKASLRFLIIDHAEKTPTDN
jgi:uncharacterized protein (TIGR03435 family)